MSDYFEVDFLNTGNGKSGDAIPIRYSIGNNIRIHVVDGGFQETGEKLVEHINKYYNSPAQIDSVIVTHPDGDHAGGLRALFDNFEINELWMLRPWLYADELIDRFSRFTSVENLKKRFKELYPNIAKLEELAEENDVPIFEPFQGNQIGDFIVLAPSKDRYLDLIVESEKTPEAIKAEQESLLEATGRLFKKAIEFIRSAWGEEVFPEEDTSPENNMSLVQYANLCGEKILLTGDAGRATLFEAIDYAPVVGLILPGIDRIQVPHHGSRHNVSTELLDELLGPKLDTLQKNFTSIISAAKEDKNHPRKAVIRAFMHRGGKVITTEGSNIRTGHNAPPRERWTSVESVPYPEDQEE
ncbi:MAG: MBL fold metallo-hydrolase [Bacteroidetes bacterium]|jgi:beta-lactamase superfamily II metal-dependent hydrolase|nr:MBL fold metallo-hydrolase [Bacteroidota bacterium]